METAEQLQAAAQAERHAKIAAQAFAYGKLRPTESNVLQGILRRAWAKDAAAADERLRRTARIGDTDTPVGSRGHAGHKAPDGEGKRAKTGPKMNAVVAARRALMVNALRAKPMTQGEMVHALGLTEAMVKSGVRMLLKNGLICKAGGTRVRVVYGVTE